MDLPNELQYFSYFNFYWYRKNILNIPYILCVGIRYLEWEKYLVIKTQIIRLNQQTSELSGK